MIRLCNILSVSNIGKIISKGPNSSYTQVVFSRLNSQETEMETENGTEIDDSLFIGQKDQTGFIGSSDEMENGYSPQKNKNDR